MHPVLPHPSLLANINRWVGVSIALVGAVAVAPGGTKLLLESTWRWLRRRGDQVRSQLARVLPFLRRDVTVHAVSATASVSAGTSLAGTATGRVWEPNSSVDERLEALRKHITEVEGRLNQLNQAVRTEASNSQRVLAELEATLRAEIIEIRRLLAEEERESALIDARGLPVVAFGILLSGAGPARIDSVSSRVGVASRWNRSGDTGRSSTDTPISGVVPIPAPEQMSLSMTEIRPQPSQPVPTASDPR
jgi:hypothetical protein